MVQSGGTIAGSVFEDATISIAAGGGANSNFVTDSSREYIFGEDAGSTVQNGGFIVVESSGSALFVNVQAGGSMTVLGSGSAPNGVTGMAELTDVFGGGLLQVQSDGVVSGTGVNGGELEVNFGVAVATFVTSNGVELIDSQAGFASRTEVVSGVEQVMFGGLSESATIEAEGSALVENEGSLVDVTVVDGGVSIERIGGVSTDATINSGGLDIVSSTGSAIDAEIAPNAEQIVSGGFTSETSVASGSLQLVVSSGIANATNVLSGGSAITETGSVLSGAQVASGGVEIERYFGVASGSIVLSGGEDIVSSTGIAVSAIINGAQLVSGGVTSATQVAARGVMTIYESGTGSATVVKSGGTEIVSSGGIVAGASVASGGVMVVESGATLRGPIAGDGGGELDLNGGYVTLTNLFVNGDITVSDLIPTQTFTDFNVLRLDPGATATLVGNANVAVGDRLIVEGILEVDGMLSVAGNLVLGGAYPGAARILGGNGTLALMQGTTNFSYGASLSMAHVSQSSAAAVAVGAIALNYGGNWTQSGGTISVAKGGVLSFSGSGDSFSGSLGGAGSVRFVDGSDTLAGTTLSAASTVVNGAMVTMSKVITLTKSLTVTSPDLLIAASGATLKGGGTLTLSNLASNKILGATAAATLTNVNDKIVGAGDIGGGAMTLVNQTAASIVGDAPGVALILDTGAKAISNAGLIASEGKGGVTIKSAVVNTGTLEVTSGLLAVTGAVTGAGVVKIAGGTADFASAFNQNVDFTGKTGTLELAKSQSYTGVITGFSFTGGPSLDLRDIAFGSKTKATFIENGVKAASGVLTVTDGTHTARITLTGNYSNSSFTLSNDGHGGTKVVDPPKSAATAPAVLPFVTAMASFGAGGGHWVPTIESGRAGVALLVAAHPA